MLKKFETVLCVRDSDCYFEIEHDVASLAPHVSIRDHELRLVPDVVTRVLRAGLLEIIFPSRPKGNVFHISILG